MSNGIVLDLCNLPPNPVAISRERFTQLLQAESQRDKWRSVAEGLAKIVQCGKDEPPERWPTDEQMDAALAVFERAKKEDAGWQFDGTAGATAKDVPPLGTQDFSTLP